MPPEIPILDGAVCSHCECSTDSAVRANEWNHSAESGGILCEECATDCGDCGHVHSPDEINDYGLCEDCEGNYTSCEDCGNRVHEDNTTNGRCDSCQENYRTCAGCDCDYHVDDMTTSDCDWYCMDCYDSRGEHDEEEETGGLIHSYGYKPIPQFRCTRGDSSFPVRREFARTQTSSRMYLGVEIECETMRGTSIYEGAAEVPVRDWYCKEDGSLSDGFEMVSHPATWNYWREANLDFLDSLKGMGFRSYNTETCGMHVHVSRNILSRLDIYKLLRFCKNAPLFLLRVSRRKKANLNQWARVFEGENQQIILKVKGEDTDGCRREAINLTNTHTIEFRIFRGTLDKYAVRRNIAFVQALILFVRETSLKRLSSGIFQQWLKTRGGDLIGRNHAQSLLESFTFMREESTACA